MKFDKRILDRTMENIKKYVPDELNPEKIGFMIHETVRRDHSELKDAFSKKLIDNDDKNP